MSAQEFSQESRAYLVHGATLRELKQQVSALEVFP
jgi:hypothetical protein